MSIKEKPLIDAVSNLGALPGFLFENQKFNGFFTVTMAALFGAFAGIFFSFFGLGDPVVLFDAIRWGARVAVIIAIFVLIGIGASAGGEPEETSDRLAFVWGGGIAVVVLMFIDFFVADYIRDIVSGYDKFLRPGID